MRLDELSRERLSEAVRLYLDEAYGGAEPPPVVRGRLAWPEGATAADAASGEVFERTPPDAAPAECQRLRLRLGNRIYPHMKLGLDRIPGTEDWVLVVDAHDMQLAAAIQESERAAFEKLTRHNTEVKTRIERRWNEAGLPTFTAYVRGRLATHKDGGPPRE